MSRDAVAGLLLVALPLLFTGAFAALARLFDYPAVLRRPTGEVLAAFAAGGDRLLLAWWALALSALLLAPTAALLGRALGDADPDLLAVAVPLGVAAALVQAIGLVRWPFAVPHLARHRDEPGVDAAFQALHRALGVGVGEHLGYVLTGAWTLLTGVAMLQSAATPGLLGIAGVALAPAFLVGALEFVGPNEREGWGPAGVLVTVAYVAWSIWLLATGVVLLA